MQYIVNIVIIQSKHYNQNNADTTKIHDIVNIIGIFFYYLFLQDFE